MKGAGRNGTESRSEPVCRTSDAESDRVEDVGVDHRRLDALVAEEFLYGPDVVAVFQQMGSERVAEGGAPNPVVLL